MRRCNRAQGIARSVHDLSHRLHPAKLRLIGLVAALQGLRHELSQPDVAITFTARATFPRRSRSDVTLCLFRIAQEALQNAIKYSGAHHVSVHLSGADGLTLTIVDDGVGFDVNAAWGRGLGLISMNERVEAVGGTFEIRSEPGAGTRVGVTVPLPVVHDTETVAV